jgi:hypothetical protein
VLLLLRQSQVLAHLPAAAAAGVADRPLQQLRASMM